MQINVQRYFRNHLKQFFPLTTRSSFIRKNPAMIVKSRPRIDIIPPDNTTLHQLISF